MIVFVGPLVWYQIIDYAKSYYLNKAAENVFGMMLFFQTCFILFRFDNLDELKDCAQEYTLKGTCAWKVNMGNQGKALKSEQEFENCVKKLQQSIYFTR